MGREGGRRGREERVEREGEKGGGGERERGFSILHSTHFSAAHDIQYLFMTN